MELDQTDRIQLSIIASLSFTAVLLLGCLFLGWLHSRKKPKRKAGK